MRTPKPLHQQIVSLREHRLAPRLATTFMHTNVYGPPGTRHGNTVTTNVRDTENFTDRIKGPKNIIASIVPFPQAWWMMVEGHEHESFKRQLKLSHPLSRRISVYHHIPAPHYHVFLDVPLQGTEKVDSWGRATSYTVREDRAKQARVSTTRNVLRAPRETYIVPFSDRDTVNEVVEIMDAHVAEEKRGPAHMKRRTWLDEQQMRRLLALFGVSYPHM